MTAFLASVTSVDEALLAARAGADIIDCKDPARGALGALPVDVVAAIRAMVPRDVPVSATIGDLPAESMSVVRAAQAMAASGCDLVKIGFFPGGDAEATIAALGQAHLGSARIVGLLLADLDPDFDLIAAMARAGFSGVMIDTAVKSGGSLTAHMNDEGLSQFISTAHDHGLFAGLAGSLRLSDIPHLLRLKPNVLGFRGALCERSERTGVVSAQAVVAVRVAMEAGVLGTAGTGSEGQGTCPLDPMWGVCRA